MNSVSYSLASGVFGPVFLLVFSGWNTLMALASWQFHDFLTCVVMVICDCIVTAYSAFVTTKVALVPDVGHVVDAVDVVHVAQVQEEDHGQGCDGQLERLRAH